MQNHPSHIIFRACLDPNSGTYLDLNIRTAHAKVKVHVFCTTLLLMYVSSQAGKPNEDRWVRPSPPPHACCAPLLNRSLQDNTVLLADGTQFEVKNVDLDTPINKAHKRVRFVHPVFCCLFKLTLLETNQGDMRVNKTDKNVYGARGVFLGGVVACSLFSSSLFRLSVFHQACTMDMVASLLRQRCSRTFSSPCRKWVGLFVAVHTVA
jgi:hypothetical protein